MNTLRRQIYYFVLLALFIFSSFRYQVGCDWSPYEILFDAHRDVSWTYILGKRETIFYSIVLWSRDMNFTYLSLNIILGLIFFIGIHVLARRQPDPLGFLVLIFPILIINMPMSAIRQGAAIGLICIALVSFMDRRPISFLIWVFLATGIHISAIVFTLLLPFSTGRYNNTRIAITAIVIIPCLVFFYSLDSAQWAINTYVGTEIESYGAAFRVFLLTLTGLYFLLMIKEKWHKTFPQDYNITSLGSMAMFLILFLLPISSVIADRFSYYLLPIQAIIFARLPYLPFRLNSSLHSALPYIGLFFIFFIYANISWHFNECFIPYNNWFFGVPNTFS
jgi:hypothetical protein